MAQKIVYQLSVRQILLIAFCSAFLAVGGVAGFNYFSKYINPTSNAETSAFNENAPQGVSDPQFVSDEQNNIEVYRAISPGVAFIKTTSYRENYFGEVQEGRGSGSGSIIDSNGHILTNEHVVRDAQQVTVSLGGDKVYPARVIGRDPDTDLAVIKIEPPREGLTVVPLGNSDQLIVGQKVLAIGNPFGLDRTLTTGVISGVQRPIRSRPQQGAPDGKPIEGAVQTDASINPGNSGGPLLDSRGRMIGINSQILSPGGGSVGVGFAVPVNIAKRVVPQLIQFGEVRRPKLGIGSRSVGELREQGVRLPVENGLLIINTYPGGSAAQAGLRGTSQSNQGEIVMGDIILSIDGEAVDETDDLYRILDRRQIGDTVQVELMRDGKRQTVPVRLQPLPGTAGRTNAPPRRF
ncbi:MAG TPA: trypsin-like peptidase domain-containing protein [Pyrinomonadaceae bacterium]|jgi:putative serine protease PepD|nr:trypsin-like peptidase domain-containing protein [Pyrinomonadaceae bacterium]